jgi:hypothetical protein
MLEKEVFHLTTSCYKQFGTIKPIFGFAKSFQIQNLFSQMPKLLVACV